MLAASVVVRAATVDDADRIGEVHVTAWQRAYQGLMPDDFLDGLSVPERQDQWRRGLGEPLADRSTLVVEDATGTVRGFATVGDCRGERPGGADVGELWAINVEPSAWGLGLGVALLQAGARELRARGHASAVLWVVDANTRARRFYERNGWSPDKAVKESRFGGAPVREVRYRRDLTDAVPARD